MINDHPNISMLETVALGIMEVCNDAVFVGGATIVLYIDDEAVQQIRTTKDVDCSVEIASSVIYYKLEEKLREKGFHHVIEEGAPLCRWEYQNILVDIMPDDPSILGFSNSWYKEGREYKKAVTLPSGTDIYIMPVNDP